MKKNKWTGLNIAYLTDEELQAGVDAMARTANQRLRQLEKSGVSKSSLSYQYIKGLNKQREKAVREGGQPIYNYLTRTAKGEIKFRTDVAMKDKKGNVKRTRGEMQLEFRKLREFLETKTSEVRGTKKYVDKAQQIYSEKLGKDIEELNKIEPDWIDELWDDDLLAHYYNLYGSGEFNSTATMGAERKLTTKELAGVLRNAGFSEASTEENKPDLETIENAFTEWDETFKKGSL